MKDNAILGRVCNLKSDFSNPENKLAFRNDSWMETELNFEVISRDESPNAGGQIDQRLGESLLELPWIDLIPVSCSVFSSRGLEARNM